MYRYIIEQHVGPGIVPWRLLSTDKHDVGGLFSWWVHGEAETDQNGERLRLLLEEVRGTIVESKPVREGAILDGATVFRIHQDTVEFEHDGKRWTQKVDEPYLAR